MSKKKKKPTPIQHRPQPRALTPKLERQLDRINDLLKQGNTTEALRQLETLHEADPRQPDILSELIRIAANIEDKHTYLRYVQRLSQLLPGDEDLLRATAQAYLANIYPALAIKTYQTFLRRFPTNVDAADVRTKISDLEQLLHKNPADRNLPKNNWLDIAILQDTVRFNLEFGYFSEARTVSNQLLRAIPDFVPGLNNLSQVEWLAGNAETAITTAQRVLTIDPENYHATANLARFLLFSGRLEEARRYAERLQSIQSEDMDFWLKKLETFSYLGDDSAILTTVKSALESKSGQFLAENELIWHYGAVAAMRTGDEKQARLWWERALEENPDFVLARANLDDLAKPSHERHAPWVYDIAHWISRAEIEKFIRAIQASTSKNKQPSPAEVKRLLAQHPGIVQRLPFMLQRGDEKSRSFAIQFAGFFPTPEIIAIVRDYALGQSGPDSSRLEAANLAHQHQAIAAGNQRMWIRSEWSDILLFGFEITGESSDTYQHSVEVIELYAEAIIANNEERFEEAEVLMKKALSMEPRKPDLLNNLAAVYSRQGRSEESTALIEEIFANHPDYFFGITNMANILIQRGKLEEAEELLRPKLLQRHYHVSEMRSLCQAQISLFIAKKKVETARTWLNMWKSFDEGHPEIERWKKRIDNGEHRSTPTAVMERLQNRIPKRKRK